MDSFVLFIDDSQQSSGQTIRNRLVDSPAQFQAYGGLVCASSALHGLAWDLREVCRDAGFDDDSEFKWSPPSGSWMNANLVGADRQFFFETICGLFEQYEVSLVLSVSGEVADFEEDRVSLRRFLHRAIRASVDGERAISFVFDLPSNGWGANGPRFLKFLSNQSSGPDHSAPRIGFELCGQSRFSRLLQAADFVTSCALAYILGRREYSSLYAERLFALIPDRSSSWPDGGFWVDDEPTRRAALFACLGDSGRNIETDVR